MKSMLRNEKAQTGGQWAVIILAVICFLVVVAAIFAATENVKPGYEAVVFDNSLGILDTPQEPGFRYMTPFWQTFIQMETRTQKEEVESDAASKDLQMVTSTVALNFHPTKGMTPALYSKVGLNYRERVIDPTIQESVKAITAQYTAEELITKREEISLKIKELIAVKLAPNFITVEEFSIVNFAFSPKFTEAIELKTEAEQLALKAQNDLVRIEIEKTQTIARAQGEAEAIRIKGAALKDNPALVLFSALGHPSTSAIFNNIE